MCSPNVEEQIARLDPEVSKIYFDAKAELANAQDSHSERFASAARIVRAFWRRLGTHARLTLPALQNPKSCA
jgi:hypothetical protein